MEEIQLFKSTGTLHYSKQDGVGYRLVLDIDQGIAEFYRSLIPRWIPVIGQRHHAHISVVRRETPRKLEYWGIHEGERIPFYYSNDIHNDHQYWWLNCFSKQLEEIRLELGLPVHSRYTLPPSGYFHCFHTTIGNTKGI